LFHNVKIPVKGFKESYPTNKRVKDNADIIIIKREDILEDSGKIKQIYIGGNDIKLSYKNIVKFFNNDITLINLIENKSVILEENIKLDTVFEEMTEVNYQMLLKYLTLGDKDSYNMGWEMLFKYDYEKSKRYFCLLLAQRIIARRRRGYDTPIRILHKSILKKVKRDFPNLR
jgi:hypothetical protein